MIELEGIGLRYGRVVLDSFSCVFGGGVNVLDGESGSGKSSIIKMILGESKPKIGHIDVPSDLVFSYVGPDASLFYDRSLLDNLRLFLGLSDLPDYLAPLADRFGVRGMLSKRIETCSGGERRKLEILYCLSKDADLYIMDEPFSSLDEDSKGALSEYLSKTRDKRNYLVVNHDKSVVFPFDHLVRIENGKAKEEGEAKLLAHSPSSREAKPASLWKAALALFRKSWLLSSLECLLAFAGLVMGLLSIACLPCKPGYANEAALSVDPFSAQLYTAEEPMTFEEFQNAQAGSISVFPMARIANESFVTLGGYLISYDGPEFLLLHGEGGESSFAIKPDFSYMRGEEQVTATFTYIDDGDERLSFLSAYSRFDDIPESTMLFLCPEQELPYVVTSIVNGDFSHRSYIEDGPIYYEMEQISLVCPTLAYGRLEFNPMTSSHLRLTPEADYRFTSSKAENGIIETNKYGWDVPCELGEDSMSFGTYSYFCFHSWMLGCYGTGYLGIAKDRALQCLDFAYFDPVDVIDFGSDLLELKQFAFAWSSGAIFVLYACVSLFGSEAKGKAFASLRQTLMHNDERKGKAGLKLALSLSLPCLFLTIIGYVLYFALILPLVNYWQMAIEYPLGYGKLGSAYEGIPMLWFHLPSWWILLLALGVIIPLIQFGILYWKRRR